MPRMAAGGAHHVVCERIELVFGVLRLELRCRCGSMEQVRQFDIREQRREVDRLVDRPSSAKTPGSQLRLTSDVRLSATASARPAGLSMSRSVRCTTTSLRPSVWTTTASVKPMSIAASCVVLPAMMLPLRSTESTGRHRSGAAIPRPSRGRARSRRSRYSRPAQTRSTAPRQRRHRTLRRHLSIGSSPSSKDQQKQARK